MRFHCNEDELLVLLARTVLETHTAQRAAQLLVQGIDLNLLFLRASIHGVFPLIYVSLKALDSSLTSNAEWQKFRKFYLLNTSRNMELAAELTTILRTLHNNGIAAIPLKGPVLATCLYSDISLRMFSDLDVLVTEDQFEHAQTTLLSSGYEYRERAQRTLEDGKHDCPLVKNNRIYVELHWTLEPPSFSVPENTTLFWQSAQRFTWNGMRILWPTAEEMLLFLCRHGSRHHWRSLKWLCDVATLLRKHSDMDWDYIINRVTETHTRRLVFLGLELANQLYGTEYPRPVWKEIERDRRVKNLGNQALNWMFVQNGAHDPSQYWAEQIQLIHLREGYLQRLNYVYTKFVRPKLKPNAHDLALIQLPDRLAFFYYLLRPIRLIRTYGPIWLRLLRHEK